MMKVAKFVLISVLGLSCVHMAAAAPAGAAPNPRPGYGNKAPLSPAEKKKGRWQITVDIAAPVKNTPKAKMAVNMALTAWQTPLTRAGQPSFFKLGGAQTDVNFPYKSLAAIRFSIVNNGSVPDLAVARPVAGYCPQDNLKCRSSAQGVHVVIHIDGKKVAAATQADLNRKVTRELGRALGLNYAKTAACELVVKPGAALPAGCAAWPSAPTTAEVSAVKKNYGFPGF
ncbi:hypothetical protein [Streptomyces sp. NPDC005533]|uniref:hypothetical protein n=1 Tax=Streptomyces sp. NPDC005533 TaxID=3364723 RepID=UPI00369B8317